MYDIYVKDLLLQARYRKTPLIVFDCETTGLKPSECHIIQLAGKVLNPIDLSVTKEFNFYLNPGYELPDKIVELTGITDEDLQDKPTEDEIFDNIYHIFGNYPFVIGHNVSFDNGFMEEMYKRQGWEYNPTSICTCKMARELLTLPNHKLQTVANYYGINVDFHRADADVEATYRIFVEML